MTAADEIHKPESPRNVVCADISLESSCGEARGLDRSARQKIHGEMRVGNIGDDGLRGPGPRERRARRGGIGRKACPQSALFESRIPFHRGKSCVEKTLPAKQNRQIRRFLHRGEIDYLADSV